jgi:hypothetical protein
VVNGVVVWPAVGLRERLGLAPPGGRTFATDGDRTLVIGATLPAPAAASLDAAFDVDKDGFLVARGAGRVPTVE